MDKKALKELRIINRLGRLDEIKSLSKRISKEIINDEINIEADEVEDFLNLLNIDLKNLSKLTSTELLLQEQENIKKRRALLKEKFNHL